jgi:hypothetical protein
MCSPMVDQAVKQAAAKNAEAASLPPKPAASAPRYENVRHVPANFRPDPNAPGMEEVFKWWHLEQHAKPKKGGSP